MTRINLENVYRGLEIFSMLREDQQIKLIEMVKQAIKEKKKLYEESKEVES